MVEAHEVPVVDQDAVAVRGGHDADGELAPVVERKPAPQILLLLTLEDIYPRLCPEYSYNIYLPASLPRIQLQ